MGHSFHESLLSTSKWESNKRTKINIDCLQPTFSLKSGNETGGVLSREGIGIRQGCDPRLKAGLNPVSSTWMFVGSSLDSIYKIEVPAPTVPCDRELVSCTDFKAILTPNNFTKRRQNGFKIGTRKTFATHLRAIKYYHFHNTK